MFRNCILRVLFVFLFLLAFAACCQPPVDVPFGVWKSENPDIILYAEPAYRHPMQRFFYLGVYTNDYEQHKVRVSFGNYPNRIFINPIETTDASSIFFSGNYEIIENTIRLINADDDNEIIFTRLEEYDPIDPLDWFPDLQDFTGVWHSEEESLTLFFETKYQSPISPHFFGIYLDDNGVERKMLVETDFRGRNMFDFPIGTVVDRDEWVQGLFMSLVNTRFLVKDAAERDPNRWKPPRFSTTHRWLPQGHDNTISHPSRDWNIEIENGKLVAYVEWWTTEIDETTEQEMNVFNRERIMTFNRIEDYTPIDPWEFANSGRNIYTGFFGGLRRIFGV